ncbi:2-methylcitrate dehydratase PrpD [Paenarthrobacter nicotinovorans]|jgi:2-methylcitrate dehydratase PrpD|uniref:2-methylcitrate dehydratase PrpD n=1 Tax=Paenarthrobacter nicotinovorans TaxID=29320 RepID=A0ABT9TN03_PAENI|nr:2-methylcitrate dehydratase PrpD [Paenarthrobacter nicotinovorans]
METTQATASQTFSKFFTSLDLSDIPSSAQHRAKLHILDTLGAGIAGSASLEAEVRRLALARRGR